MKKLNPLTNEKKNSQSDILVTECNKLLENLDYIREKTSNYLVSNDVAITSEIGMLYLDIQKSYSHMKYELDEFKDNKLSCRELQCFYSMYYIDYCFLEKSCANWFSHTSHSTTD